ncbi:23S rRNA (uracil(1939)-C(5))-methyltransferase RlmD [Candidatus Peregrinibacteria bacterium]|nr:23S rRNA (uracil(1939)-C(5))-methyltransferase RlmD [Candidatus Peregrinibacteria bacterium]
MQLKKGELITVNITKIAFGGAGIGHYNGKVVFIENTVPGDTVNAHVTRIKPSFLEAKKDTLITPSPLRITPRCTHFNTCGGCSFQYVDYTDQLRFKEEHVAEALTHLGAFTNPPMRPITACNSPWFYRNKMEFSFSMNKDDTLHVGLHPKGFRYDVFDLRECYLQHEDIGPLLTSLVTFFREKGMQAYHFTENAGLLRTLTIREGIHTNERMIILTTSHKPFKHKEDFVHHLLNSTTNKKPTSIILKQHIARKGHRTRFITETLYGKPHLTEEMNVNKTHKLTFNILPDAFFQPNTKQAELLYKHVLTLSEIDKNDVVYDLFCGTGTIGLFCAHKAKYVFGFDINANAIKNAQENADNNGITNVRYEAGDAFKLIKHRQDNPQVVIVDPPRSGLGEKLYNHLLTIQAQKIIYVSCNPATLARDLSHLCKHGYTLKVVQPVDMFPQTYHIETVCQLIKQ